MAKQVANSDCESVIVDTYVGNESDTTTPQTGLNSDFADVHDLVAIKAGLITLAWVLLSISVTAFIALNRTRAIPKTACILSSSLLWFDCATILAFAVRNIVTDNIILNILTMVGLTMSSASFINIAVMSMDRLILFQWPYFYIRHFTNGSYVYFYYIIVVGFIVSFCANWMQCFISPSSFWDVRQCIVPLITVYMATSHVASVLFCFPCFVWIAIIVAKQQRKERSKSERNPTMVVLLCCINYSITTVIVLILLFTACYTTIIFRRTATDLLYMFNGLLDTFVYVLWFKECRYELLKIVSCFVPPLRPKLEKMRHEVFDVIGTCSGTT